MKITVASYVTRQKKCYLPQNESSFRGLAPFGAVNPRSFVWASNLGRDMGAGQYMKGQKSSCCVQREVTTRMHEQTYLL